MSILLQKYLRFWAKIYLGRAKPKIIGVTGSVGKTSTKEAIFEVLKIKFKDEIRKSEGNLNNETGAPLAILGYKSAPSYGSSFFGWFPIIISCPFKVFMRKVKILVLELAADKPGDIAYLTSFIKPNITCITNIGSAHLEAFGTIENIIKEKTVLIRALPAEGTAVLNVDDKELKKISSEISNEQVNYAISGDADVVAKNITTEISDFKPLTKFQVISEDEKFRAETHTLGRVSNIYSALAAVAVGIIFEMPMEEIVEGLGNVKAEKHRMEVFRGKKNCIIIDDSYNANPLSMKAALDILKDIPNPPNGGRKIAVLGGMREIGKITDEAHKLIGAYAKEVADEVVVVGELAKKYQAEKYFENVPETSNFLLSNIQEGDIILIKASRSIGLEKIVEALKEGK